MKRVPRFSLPLVFLIFLSVPGAAYPQDIVVIVNKANPIAELSLVQLRQIYRGEMTRWPGGRKIVPLNRGNEAEIRSLFTEKVMGKSVMQMSRYWIEMRLKTGLNPPKVLGSSEAVKMFVSRVPNAVGYIYAGEVDDSIKVVFRLDGR